MLGQPEPIVPVPGAATGPAQFGRAGVVSLWVGTFASVAEAEAYFGIPDEIGVSLPAEAFAAAFGLGNFSAETLEANFEQAQPRPLREILGDATFAGSFIDAALAAAESHGISEAQGIALLYDFDYRLCPSRCDTAGPVRFIGAFPYVAIKTQVNLQPFQEVANRLGYPLAAVLLVIVALSELGQRKRRARPGTPVQHSGYEYCQYLVACRGPDTPALLGELGLRRSEDVGRIMFDMVDARLVRRHDNDSEADFANLYVLADDGTLSWTGPPPPSPERPSRWWLLGILGVPTIVVWLLWLGGWWRITNSAQDHAAAAAAIARFGGVVQCVAQQRCPGGMREVCCVTFPPAADADAGLVHVRRLRNARHIALAGSRVTDAGLAELAGLRDIEILWLGRTRISDAGLCQLRGLRNLQMLWLHDTPISDAGIAHLTGMTNLHELLLSNTQITDGGLTLLRGLTKLGQLRLNGTHITGAGLAALSTMRQLYELDLSNTRVDDAGLVHLASLPYLRDLRLDGTRVTDAGLAALTKSPRLYALSLGRTAITDAGLKQLSGLKLEILDLNHTAITDAGLTQLAAGNPGLEDVRIVGTRATKQGAAALQKALHHAAVVTLEPSRRDRVDLHGHVPSDHDPGE